MTVMHLTQWRCKRNRGHSTWEWGVVQVRDGFTGGGYVLELTLEGWRLSRWEVGGSRRPPSYGMDVLWCQRLNPSDCPPSLTLSHTCFTAGSPHVFCWDQWVPGTGAEEARTWRQKNWWRSWCVWGWSVSESGGEGRESRSDGDGPGPGEEGPLLSGGEQGGGTEGCDRAEPRAWTLLPLGKSSSVNWQNEGSEAGNRQGFDRCHWSHPFAVLARHPVRGQFWSWV